MAADIIVAPPSVSAASPAPIEPVAIAAASKLSLIMENFIQPPKRWFCYRRLAPQQM